MPTGKICKIAAGGYHLLALTTGNDLYGWGGHPGRISLLDEISTNPAPITIDDVDILDCAVGEQHMIILSSNREVYVIGDNANGQLGLPLEKASSWAQVKLELVAHHWIVSVDAGARSSFILTGPRSSKSLGNPF